MPDKKQTDANNAGITAYLFATAADLKSAFILLPLWLRDVSVDMHKSMGEKANVEIRLCGLLLPDCGRLLPSGLSDAQLAIGLRAAGYA
jgi:hypothetical protein